MVSGTIVDYDAFDAKHDCEALHKAMKGLVSLKITTMCLEVDIFGNLESLNNI